MPAMPDGTSIAVTPACISVLPDATVLPSSTDPAICTFDFPQAIYHPAGVPRHQLLLFLTGTGGRGPVCCRLSKNAALLGYHVVQIMYPNDIPASACQHESNPDAFGDFRWAIIRGGTACYRDRRVEIPVVESIEHRSIKLLRYLAHTEPGHGWGQYLAADGLAWDRIAVAGASQGGGHAALMATRYRVARVLCFAAPKDYCIRLKGPARWYEDSVTPASRYFVFNNVHDRQGCDHAQQVENLRALGVVRSDADLADVDTEAAPYHGAHALFTSWPGADGHVESLPAHVSVATDRLLAKDGSALFRPVWRYMLGAPTD